MYNNDNGDDHDNNNNNNNNTKGNNNTVIIAELSRAKRASGALAREARQRSTMGKKIW